MSMDIESVVKKIRLFHYKHRRMPSYQEMCRLFGFASKNASFDLAKKLIKLGIVDKNSKGRLILNKALLPIPVLGTIKAGIPTDAEEQVIDEVTFDDYLVDRPESSYLLKVSGDSMIEAGLEEGDIVVVDKKIRPKDGDIVVANIDDEFTLKYLQKENGKTCLVPANPKYSKIYPKDNLTIEGVVVSSMRKYR
jgi:SOS regulatory protein LexA